MTERLHHVSCRHYNGLNNDACEKGIDYKTVRDDSGDGMYRWPCLGAANWRPCNTTCAHFELYTKEELEAQDREVAAIIEQLTKFDRRESEDCPHCKQHVERLEKVGRCVYARPCNCRVWQGTIPEVWKS
jgi:hypothetical protein